MSQSCIMIVEGDVLVRSPLAEYLRECGYRVLEAATDAESRELLSQCATDIDVILIDIDADDGSGFELATSIRRSHSHVEVMLASTVAKALERAGELCEDGSALIKPYDYQAVADQISRMLAAREQKRSME